MCKFPQLSIRLIGDIDTIEAFTLDDLCDTLHISKYYACHLFKRSTGISIMQYVTDLKISETKKLLINSDTKIREIAELLQYKDSNTFCKAFKRSVKCSPKQFRTMYRFSNKST